MLAARLFWRDWRSGELSILAAALLIAVTLVTTVSLFTNAMEDAIVGESGNFLAADQVLKSSRPVDEKVLAQADGLQLKRAATVSLNSMVQVGEQFQLVSLKAVDQYYPLRGELLVRDAAYSIDYVTDAVPNSGEVWVDNRLLPLLGLNVGDTLNVGSASFTIKQIIVNEPDKGATFYSVAPRVLMNLSDLPSTNLIMPGSRVTYRYLFAGDSNTLSVYKQLIAPELDSNQEWLDLEDAAPRIVSSTEQAKQFLLLAALLSIALAGIAVALASRRFAERHVDYVAIMKTLGASSRRIITVYALNLAALIVVASLTGWLLGLFAQQFLIQLLDTPVALDVSVMLQSLLMGAVTAFSCVMLFALPPLLNLLQASPLRVLRRDIPARHASTLASVALAFFGMAFILWIFSGDWQMVMTLMLAIMVIVAIIAMFAWVMLRSGVMLGLQAGSVWQLAFAALRRRVVSNAVQIAIFSLTIMLLLTLVLVRTSLIHDWQKQIPEKAPNHFLVNISPEQLTAVSELLEAETIRSDHLYPIVRGRLVAINGENIVATVTKEDIDNRRTDRIDRELSLTWAQQLPEDNRITQGQWWQAETDKPQVSVEQRLAEKMQIKLNDTLKFQIGSEHVTATVSSIRELNWFTMRPNFYMIFSPGSLDAQLPAYLTSFYLPPEKKSLLNQFVKQFPTVTILELDSLINQIQSTIRQVSRAIEVVTLLIVIGSLLILIASIQAGRDDRLHEGALLRTLGAKRSLIMNALWIEFFVLGFIAGLLAILGAEVAAWLVHTYLLNLPNYQLHLGFWILSPVFSGLLIAATGHLLCRQVVSIPPITVLRQLTG